MKSSVLALLGAASTASAAVRGFNYASQGQNEASFAAQFRTAAQLAGADDFTSARLYTMIQDGTTNTPIEAIQAAIDTDTTLLLGLWASVDSNTFQNEITALKNAITQHGPRFADLVQGISVGSEDLYRISPTGIMNKSGVGQSPDVLVQYIQQVRDAIAGTSLASKPVGHVDTWNVYVNGTNNPVISACDFLGLDEYPYFQTTDVNPIENGHDLFFEAYDKVAGVSQGKPIWITEAGWPTSGPTSGQAVASVENAETFWQEVACELEDRNIDFWWYILADAGASPSFGVSENGQPLYNLACNDTSTRANSTSSDSSSGSGSATRTGAAGATGTGGASATQTGDVVLPSNWAASKTPAIASSTGTATGSAATATFSGAASKVVGPFAGLAVGALAAAFVL